MELSREQIIKALECCWHEMECVGDECPLFKPINDCAPLMAMEALTLIKKLEMRIDDLEIELEATIDG